MRSNLILLAFAVTLLSVVASYDLNFLDYENPIPHAEWKGIGWPNFRGHNNPFHTLHGKKEFAFIVTELQVERDNNKVNVVALFHPSRSYVFNKKNRDRNLLRHELYHFHIAEYCARMIRRELSETGYVSDQYIELVTEEYHAVEDSLQRTYDEETYHSYRLGKQREWERKIDSCLLTLEAFDGTVVDLKAGIK